MKSQTLKESLDFFLYLFDEEDKDVLKEIWLAKEVDMSLQSFIDKHSKKRYISKVNRKQILENDTDSALKNAESILNLGYGKEVRLDGNL